MGRLVLFELFVPPSVANAPLDGNQVAGLLGHDIFKYAALGRLALVHCLNALGVKGKVLLPAYLCATVPQQLQLRGWGPCYYDLDPLDLNADVKSVEAQILLERPAAVLVASMYGNPADLMQIEALCRREQVWMIDDAAQSAGATLGGKPVGSFGDAGFFSFSPGKSTPGALGSFYWCSSDVQAGGDVRHRPWIHALGWMDYFVHRQGAYTWAKMDPLRLISKIRNVAFRSVDMLYDGCCEFEVPWLGGMVNAVCTHQFEYRRHGFEILASALEPVKQARLIRAVRGEAHPHKAVLVMDKAERCRDLLAYLGGKGVKALAGYEPLCVDRNLVPNALALSGRIAELPIERDENKMKALGELMREFFE